MEPLAYGDYPFIMRAILRERLPHFTNEESKMVKDSFDFIGVNYYSARYAIPTPENFTPKYNIQDSYTTNSGMFYKQNIFL